jgi:hypothetical protein
MGRSIERHALFETLDGLEARLGRRAISSAGNHQGGLIKKAQPDRHHPEGTPVDCVSPHDPEARLSVGVVQSV